MDQEKSGLTVYQYCEQHNLSAAQFNRSRKELKKFLKANLFVDLGAPLYLFSSSPELSCRIAFDGIVLKVAKLDRMQLHKLLEIIASVRLEVPLYSDVVLPNDSAANQKDSGDSLPTAAGLSSNNL